MITNTFEQQQQAWYYRLLSEAMLETQSPSEAVQIAHACLSLQPMPPAVALPDKTPITSLPDKPFSAFFAHDIENKAGQGILNRALEAAKKLSAAARKELENAIAIDDAARSAERVVAFLAKYRTQLARLLSSTQLASLLEGAREVARHVPPLLAPGAVPLPPSLEPQEALKLVENLRSLPTRAAQNLQLYQLPPEQQHYVQQVLAAGEGPPAIPPILPAALEDEEERVHLVTIEKAVDELARKNVVTRAVFDRLDAVTRSKAFTIAQVESDETLTKVRDALAETVAEGVDLKAFREKVLQKVEPATFLSDAHLETVFRTNVQGALSDGQYSLLQHPLIREAFPYAHTYPLHDSRVREEHLAMEQHGIDGTAIYRVSDPVWQLFRPPWDYNCRCGWAPMTIRQAAEKGVKTAAAWLDSGQPPDPPDFVSMPPWRPPEGFQRALEGTPLSIRLSMQPLGTFSVGTAELLAPVVNAGSDKPVSRVRRRKGKKVCLKGLRARPGVALAAEEWVSYQGKRGGKGWRNAVTGKVVYQAEKPVGRGPGKPEGPGRAPAAPDEPKTRRDPEQQPSSGGGHIGNFPAESRPKKVQQRKNEPAPMRFRPEERPHPDAETAQRAANAEYSYIAAPVQFQKELDGGINGGTSVALRKDGKRSVFKPIIGENKGTYGQRLRQGIQPGTFWKREIGASLVARAIEMDHLVPETTVAKMNDNVGSSQLFSERSTKASMLPERDWFGNRQDIGKAAVFDYLIGHEDRHEGNWMISPLGRMVLIDNGLSFPSEYHEQDFFNFNIMHKALLDNESLPNVSAWDWKKVQSSIEGIIDDKAIALMKERFDALQASNAKARAEGRAMTMADLPGWGGGTSKDLIDAEERQAKQFMDNIRANEPATQKP
jgi:hypothetical protein